MDYGVQWTTVSNGLRCPVGYGVQWATVSNELRHPIDYGIQWTTVPSSKPFLLIYSTLADIKYTVSLLSGFIATVTQISSCLVLQYPFQLDSGLLSLNLFPSNQALIHWNHCDTIENFFSKCVSTFRFHCFDPFFVLFLSFFFAFIAFVSSSYDLLSFSPTFLLYFLVKFQYFSWIRWPFSW